MLQQPTNEINDLGEPTLLDLMEIFSNLCFSRSLVIEILAECDLWKAFCDEAANLLLPIHFDDELPVVGFRCAQIH